MNRIERLKNLIVAKKAPTPSQTFDKEVAARAKRYGELRKLVAEVLFLVAQQDAAITERRAELARLHHRALVAARRGRTLEARQLERAREASRAAIAEAEAELTELRAAATDAKDLLHGAGTDLADLAKEAEAVRRTERLHALTARLGGFEDAAEPDLEAARHTLERMRAERALEAELEALPARVG